MPQPRSTPEPDSVPGVGLVIVAAGSGSRLGAGIPKAFVMLDGRTLLAHALDRLGRRVSQVVVVAPGTHLDQARAQAASVGVDAVVVAGGDTRAASVAGGLAALRQVDIVAVHDAARPLVDAEALDACVRAVMAGASAAAPAVPITDTIKRVGPDHSTVLGTVDRTTLRAVQTPQVFPLAILLRAHELNDDAGVTDDLALVEQVGGTIVLVDGHHRYLKITHADDLAVARALIHAGGDPVMAARTDGTGVVAG